MIEYLSGQSYLANCFDSMFLEKVPTLSVDTKAGAADVKEVSSSCQIGLPFFLFCISEGGVSRDMPTICNKPCLKPHKYDSNFLSLLECFPHS